MTLFSISYDLQKPGQNYPQIINRLQNLGAKRVLYSNWVLFNTASATQLRDDLERYIDAGDRILVTEVRDWASYNLITPIPTQQSMAY